MDRATTFVNLLGHSTHIFLTGPSPSYRESVEFIARDRAASTRYRSHTEPTVREIDGIEVGQFRGISEHTTDVVAIAVDGEDKYGFELSVFNSDEDILDQAVDDFERMLSSIRWQRE